TYNADAKSGFLEIKVEDRTPAIAADLANYYVIALGNLVSNIGLYKAMQKSKFYDAQVAAAKTDLLNAQNAVKAFLNTNGVTAANQTIIAAGISTQLQAQLAVAQSQLHAIERYATVDNPDYKQLQSQIAGLNAQIISLSGTKKDEIAIPSNLAPALAQDYLNLAMQVAFRGEIYNLLMKQYEMNKLDTLSDQQPLAVQIIDPAVVPIYKSKPNSLKIIWIVLLLAVLMAILFILVKNHKLIYVK
nr:hypothetical protein [Burkholderiales bacterium]